MPNWKKTTWSPDTCGCEVIYRFDHDQPIAGQDPDPVSVTLCREHEGLPPGLQNKFKVIWGDNQRKNDMLEEIGNTLGLRDNPDFYPKLYDRYVERWYMSGVDDRRVVHIVTKNLVRGQKNTVQSAANSKFGVGKVAIE